MCRMGFITGGPNEAIVVSGCLHSQPLIVVGSYFKIEFRIKLINFYGRLMDVSFENYQVGGWAFVIPCVQRVQRISLNVMTIKVKRKKRKIRPSYTRKKIQCSFFPRSLLQKYTPFTESRFRSRESRRSAEKKNGAIIWECECCTYFWLGRKILSPKKSYKKGAAPTDIAL